MTVALPSQTPADASVDPHVSKIAPDDPRLRVRPARGRTLKKGPAIALVVALGGTLAVSLIVALLPPSKAPEAKRTESESPAAAATPIVPEAIRNAPEHAGPARPPPPTDRLLVVPLPDAGAYRAALARDPEEALPPPEQAAPVRETRTRDPRQEQDLRARGSAILFETPRGGAPMTSAAPPAPTASPPPAPLERPQSGNLLDDPNFQGRKNSFLDSERPPPAADYLRTRLEHPQSPFEVKAGTIVPAVLITAINSDLPGPVIGQVRENVYDTVSGNYLLIPQGSRLLAQYDSMVAWGQERVLVCWRRLIFPNGDSLSLECMPAADLSGAAGLTDDVNEHWGRILKGVAVASLLAATTQAVAGNTEGFNPTVPQTWARGTASEVNQAGQQITRRNLNIQPTITIRPGFSVNVIVTKDLVLPQAYASEPAAPSAARTARE